jgi:hypothetical protein
MYLLLADDANIAKLKQVSKKLALRRVKLYLKILSSQKMLRPILFLKLIYLLALR